MLQEGWGKIKGLFGFGEKGAGPGKGAQVGEKQSGVVAMVSAEELARNWYLSPAFLGAGYLPDIRTNHAGVLVGKPTYLAEGGQNLVYKFQIFHEADGRVDRKVAKVSKRALLFRARVLLHMRLGFVPKFIPELKLPRPCIRRGKAKAKSKARGFFNCFFSLAIQHDESTFERKRQQPLVYDIKDDWAEGF
eukprot:gene1030-619_t